MNDNFYEDVYLNRLNRYGNDYQSRITGQRRKVFENYLYKTPFRVEFMYNDNFQVASLEPYKQNETKTLQYLLTDLALKLPNGTILEIEKPRVDINEIETNYWMVYWLEEKLTAGYNRYVVLEMTHFIEWKDRDGKMQSTYAYFYGQEDNMLKDELKSRSRDHALYNENLKMSFFILPFNSKIRKDDYLEVTIGEEDNKLTEAYTVVGYDIHSTPGVEYVTVDPVYLRDNTPAPEQSTEPDEEYFWLNGGN